MEIKDPKYPNLRYNSYSERYKKQNQEKLNPKPSQKQEKEKDEEPGPLRKDIKRLEDNSERILRNAESIVISRKARKIEKVILIAIYAIVILIAIYFILASFFPNYLPFSSNTYTIKASDSTLFNNLKSFYIDDPSVLGDKQIINGVTVRPIISSKKFNFVFKPTKNIPSNQNATFSMDLVLNQSNPGPVYVNDKLIFPDLTNYEFLKETPTDYIYASNDTMSHINKNNFKDADTTEDYIYKNIPGASVWSTRDLNPVNITIPDYKQQNTLINGTFRGNLNLAVYADGNLNINFIKQDLNSYLGEDTYNLTITNSNGDIIYNKIFGDDGDKLNDNKLGPEQYYSFGLYSLKSDVYYINFESDNNNDAFDSTLKNININSNKILILGNFLPWETFTFYTKSNNGKNIGLYYWWTGKDQIINITGTQNKKINLDINWFSKRYDQNLPKGEYTIITPIGYLWFYNDLSSPSKENWFDLPYNQQQDFNNPNLILIDKSNFNKDTGDLAYIQNVNIIIPLKVGLRSLNSNSTNLEDAKISLS